MTESDERAFALPGTPPPVLARIWDGLTKEARELVLDHLTSETSAEWLAHVLSDERPVSATTIRTYRRALRRQGVLV